MVTNFGYRMCPKLIYKAPRKHRMGHKTKHIYTKTSPTDKLIHIIDEYKSTFVMKRYTGTVKT